MRGIVITNLVLNIFIFIILLTFIIGGLLVKDTISDLITKEEGQ
jgi:hypothetical protein